MTRTIWILIGLSLPIVGHTKGHWVGNGGDSLAMSIYNRTVELQKIMAALKPECSADLSFSADQLEQILTNKTNKLFISTTPDTLYLVENGRQVFKEAINDPEANSVVFNRDAYRSSPNKDQLIVHEMMGLKSLKDPNGVESTNVATVLANPLCLPQNTSHSAKSEAEGEGEGDAVAALGNGEIPVASQVDSNGVIYFQVEGRQQIYRYSIVTRQFLAPLITREIPISFAVASALNRIYIAYHGRAITFIDLKNPKTETPFATAEYIQEDWDEKQDIDLLNKLEIGELIVSGQTLIIAPDRKFQWRRFVYYNANAQRIGQTTWVEPDVGIAVTPNGRGLYYISNFSPRSIRFLPYTSYFKDDQAPRAGDFDVYPLDGPLLTSAHYLAVGSGLILRQPDMAKVATLNGPFESGTWVASTFYAGHSLKQGFAIHGYSGPAFTKSFERIYDAGSLIALHAYGKHVVAIWVTDDGDVQVDEIVK